MTATDNDGIADYISWFTGDDATAGNRPVLSVTYTVPVPAITSASSATGTNGRAFSYTIAASNSPTSYAALNLPPGLSLNTSTGLISGTSTVTGTFSATIGAINVNGAGTAILTIAVLPTPPSSPTGLTATGTDGQVGLAWNGSAGATSYTILRSETSGSGYQPVVSGTTNTTNFSDATVTNGTTYYYVVRATNAGGTSANSAQASAQPLSPVQALRLVNFGTISNSGNAADSADPDGDGMTNAQE